MSDQGCDFVGHWQILVGPSDDRLLFAALTTVVAFTPFILRRDDRVISEMATIEKCKK